MPTPSEDPLTSAIQNSINKSKKNNSNHLDTRIFTSCHVLEKKIDFDFFEPPSQTFSDLNTKCVNLKKHQKQICKKSTHKSSEENGTNETLYTKSSVYKTPSKPNEENGIKETLYLKSLVHTWKPKTKDKTGLRNLGNTCYLNASLQALFHIPSFVNWIINDDHCHKLKKCLECGCINCAIYKIVKLFFNTPSSAISPDAVIYKLNYISKNSFTQGRQEDAHEFLRLLLEKMDQDYMEKNFGKDRIAKFPPSLKFTTPIYKIFGGMIRTTVKCNNCHESSTTYNPFLDLSLDIARSRSIQDALSLYFDEERVDYQCAKCRIKGVSQKQFLIKTVPKLLCLHLKRFHNNHSKFTGPIPFSKTLDLSKYVIKSANNPVNKKITYGFVAAINHHGANLSNGHYTTFALTANKHTAMFDDEQVDFMNFSQANIERDMYVLFYQLESILSQNVPSDSAVSTNSTSNHISSNNSEVRLPSAFLRANPFKLDGFYKRPSTSFDITFRNEKRRKLPDKQDSTEEKDKSNPFLAAYYKLQTIEGEDSEWKRDFKKRLKENIKLVQSNRA